MTSIEELSAAITEEIEPKRDFLEAQLPAYVSARRTEQDAKFVKEKIGELLKLWLTNHGGERLYDGEHEIEAYMETRSKPGRDCDLRAIYEGNKPLFEQLLFNGCLSVKEDAIKAAGALVGGVERYLAPKGQTTALQVKEKR